MDSNRRAFVAGVVGTYAVHTILHVCSYIWEVSPLVKYIWTLGGAVVFTMIGYSGDRILSLVVEAPSASWADTCCLNATASTQVRSGSSPT